MVSQCVLKGIIQERPFQEAGSRRSQASGKLCLELAHHFRYILLVEADIGQLTYKWEINCTS